MAVTSVLSQYQPETSRLFCLKAIVFAYAAYAVLSSLTKSAKQTASEQHNEIVPAVNQIETHPFNQQIETQTFLQDQGVQIESWGPFAEGKNDMFSNELLGSIGQKYGKSIAQVVLRWLIQRDVVVIPKSVRKERIIENITVFDFDSSAEDMTAIGTLDQHVSAFLDHRDPATVK